MSISRLLSGACLTAGALCMIQPAAAENYELIVKGTVVTRDGSPLPKTVGIERICSDYQGSAPGVITNSKGEYQWRLMVDPTLSRACYVHATSNGYTSTTIDISSLNGYIDKTITLPPLILVARDSDPYAINPSDNGIPSKAASAWRAAMKALDANKNAEAVTQLEAAVKAVPFARGFHTLGIITEHQGMLMEAKDAYEHAIAADPKMLPPYATLAKLCVKLKDWKCAASNADAVEKADSKHLFPQVYLHQAAALLEMNDLAGAETAAREGLKRDPNHLIMPRLQFVLGRILDAKGDYAGAREEFTKYLSIDKDTPDAELIRARMMNLGQPNLWAGTDLELI
jgi:tetratricopeptide (TPR) repeat protein